MIVKKLLIVLLPIVYSSAFSTDNNTSYNTHRIWEDFDEAYQVIFGEPYKPVLNNEAQNNNTENTQQNIHNNTQQQLEKIQKDIDKLNINDKK